MYAANTAGAIVGAGLSSVVLIASLGTQNAQRVMQSNDQSDIIQCIDDLEAIGDEAKRACTSTRPSPQVQSVVVRVHDELSNLKHQLH